MSKLLFVKGLVCLDSCEKSGSFLGGMVLAEGLRETFMADTWAQPLLASDRDAGRAQGFGRKQEVLGLRQLTKLKNCCCLNYCNKF